MCGMPDGGGCGGGGGREATGEMHAAVVEDGEVWAVGETLRLPSVWARGEERDE